MRYGIEILDKKMESKLEFHENKLSSDGWIILKDTTEFLPMLSMFLGQIFVGFCVDLHILLLNS
jgi:hypothetical protein